jgi:hypothetical protein
MADNYTATPGSGLAFGADELTIGGVTVLVPRIKLVVGADGSGADLAPGQATMSASLPVVIASDQGNLPTSIAACPITLPVSATIAVDSVGFAKNDTLTDGTQRSIARGAAMGTTAAADITGTTEGDNHQALDVQVYSGGTAVNPAEIRALTTNDNISTTPVASEVHVGEVGGKIAIATSSFARPNNTTQYTAGDALNAFESGSSLNSIAVGRVNTGNGKILAATLTDSAAQSVKGDFTLYLFDDAITAPQDNVLFNPTSAEIKSCLGAIQFANPISLPSNCLYEVNDLNIGFQCGENTQNIFWVLVANNAYTPVANEEFCLRLHVEQN